MLCASRDDAGDGIDAQSGGESLRGEPHRPLAGGRDREEEGVARTCTGHDRGVDPGFARRRRGDEIRKVLRYLDGVGMVPVDESVGHGRRFVDPGDRHASRALSRRARAPLSVWNGRSPCRSGPWQR